MRKLSTIFSVLVASIVTMSIISSVVANEPVYAQLMPHTTIQVPSNTGSGFGRIGLSPAQLGDAWWKWAMSIDKSRIGDPFNDATGALCNLGR